MVASLCEMRHLADTCHLSKEAYLRKTPKNGKSRAEWTKSKLPDTAPACVHDEGSRRLVLSGLNHTTFDLTVYASQDGSPHHHARLASGCWSSFARRDSYPQGFIERFQSSSLFLLPKAYLTQRHHTYLG